jgi:hypothetical protein
VRKVPERPLQQVFIHDPDGVMIELNFWHEELVPEIEDTDALPGKRTRAEMKQAPKKKAKVPA